MPTLEATAVAYSNIALVKYWGKFYSPLNLPAAPSLSASLDGLKTKTHLRFDPTLKQDQLTINGSVTTGRALSRITAFLDLFREIARRRGVDDIPFATISTTNLFPTAAGLASSASGFAALALAADAALDLQLPKSELSALARQGSGSAARSIFGGFVEMSAGRDDSFSQDLEYCRSSDDAQNRYTEQQLSAISQDAHAQQIFGPDHWRLDCTIGVTAHGEKSKSSTRGMEQTMETSPYYPAWLRQVPSAIAEAKLAIAAKDFEKLGEIAEASALQMHASAIAARPGILYWNGMTVTLIETVRQLREDGVAAFFTIDAGPHVKIFSQPSDTPKIVERLKDLDLVDILGAKVGGSPQLL